MTIQDALRLLLVLVRSGVGLDSWVAADEMRHAFKHEGYVYTAQQIGSKLHALENRGLVEARDEGWGKLWRPASSVRDVLAPCAWAM